MDERSEAWWCGSLPACAKPKSPLAPGAEFQILMLEIEPPRSAATNRLPENCTQTSIPLTSPFIVLAHNSGRNGYGARFDILEVVYMTL